MGRATCRALGGGSCAPNDESGRQCRWKCNDRNSSSALAWHTCWGPLRDTTMCRCALPIATTPVWLIERRAALCLGSDNYLGRHCLAIINPYLLFRFISYNLHWKPCVAKVDPDCPEATAAVGAFWGFGGSLNLVNPGGSAHDFAFPVPTRVREFSPLKPHAAAIQPRVSPPEASHRSAASSASTQ